MITDDFNCARYRAGQAPGHYESYFQRANHPAQPLAFWVRYTIFSPTGRPQDAIGELWAVVFNASTGRHVVAKTEVPIDRCAFSNVVGVPMAHFTGTMTLNNVPPPILPCSMSLL